MKTCPVCKAVAFDDAAVCYGCLHDFAREGEKREVLPTSGIPLDDATLESGVPLADDAQPTSGTQLEVEMRKASDSPPGKTSLPLHARGSAATEFIIRFTPTLDPSGSFSWSCAVET